jgi:HSP20 family protein
MIRKTPRRNDESANAVAAPTAALSRKGPPESLLQVYWDNPFAMVHEFDHMFEALRRRMESDFLGYGPLFASPSALPSGPEAHPARADLKDTGKEFELTADLPGFEKDQVTIHVTREGLELEARAAGEKSEEDDGRGYIARERRYRSLHRAVAFPEDVDPDKVSAELKNGVLTVRVPKADPSASKRTKVEVK